MRQPGQICWMCDMLFGKSPHDAQSSSRVHVRSMPFFIRPIAHTSYELVWSAPIQVILCARLKYLTILGHCAAIQLIGVFPIVTRWKLWKDKVLSHGLNFTPEAGLRTSLVGYSDPHRVLGRITIPLKHVVGKDSMWLVIYWSTLSPTHLSHKLLLLSSCLWVMGWQH